MTFSGLVNPAGGLRYHQRALRHAKNLWHPFRWALGEWLLAWEPPETTLLLVGPSGGYNLQPFFFERFDRVVCLEPDPVARAVFGWKLSHAPLDRRPKLEFISDDRLVRHPERFLPLLSDLGDACLLFSNIIGQLRALLAVSSSEAPELARVRDVVRQSLVGRSWASFHDRFSGELRPAFEGTLLSDGRPSDEQLVERAYADEIEKNGALPAELLDHLTEGFFPTDLEHAYFSWELDPGLFHLIEAVRSAKVAGRA
jgi:hypothetical protein